MDPERPHSQNERDCQEDSGGSLRHGGSLYLIEKYRQMGLRWLGGAIGLVRESEHEADAGNSL